jgi:hypothetical protein
MMAKHARPEAEEGGEIQKPDFEKALRILSNDVRPAEEKNAGSRGDLSAAWKSIENDCHCNKAAAKAYYKLAGMSPETRDDYLRTLYGLMQLGGIGISRDLVDEMEGGEPPAMPISTAGERPGLATLETTH